MVQLNTSFKPQTLSIGAKNTVQTAKVAVKEESQASTGRLKGSTQTTDINDIDQLNSGDDFKFPWRKILKTLAYAINPLIGALVDSLIGDDLKSDANAALQANIN